MKIVHLLKSIGLFVILQNLSGCGTIQEYIPPDNPEGASETDLRTENPSIYQSSEPVQDWWNQLEDKTLSILVESALSNNLDIEVALANITETRASFRERRFERYPIVTAGASSQRIRVSQKTPSGAFIRDNTFNQFDYGFDASWEMDVLGRVSSRIAASEALYEASIYDMDNLYVTVASEVARLYIELRGAQYRLEIAERNASNQTETFELTNTLAEGGRATALDTTRADAQLNTTLASIPPLKAEITTAINQLSVLTGNVPDYLREQLMQPKPLPTIPATMNVGDVTSLIERRPDIRLAERLLAARVAEYNVSATELFPRVNILGFLGFVATTISTLGSGAAIDAFVGPSLNWRAFDLGRARAEVDQSDARAQQALSTYEKTVLEALEEIQSSLTRFTHERERRARLQDAAVAIKESASIAQERYQLGVDAFIDVLDAQSRQLETEDALAISEIQLATNLISIYKALGGGWRFDRELNTE